MPAYHEAFQAGGNLRIADEAGLRTFQQYWGNHHHPLQETQIIYAGQMCHVLRISYYHGGECLYELGTWVLDSSEIPPARYPKSHQENVLGYWHEACLRDHYADEWEAQLPVASEVYTVTAEQRLGQPVIIVKTLTGIECLIARHLNNVQEAARMNEVASLRNSLSFERRYAFEGVTRDALYARYIRP